MTVEQAMANFCTNVKRLRRCHGLSKKNMAAICGIGVATLERLENGCFPARMGAGVMLRLADHFDLTTQALLASPSEEMP